MGSPEAPLQALIFDSWFDPYRGVVVLARVVQGTLSTGMRIKLWSNNQVYNVEELGVLTPKPVRVEQLGAGEVGFVVANIKRISESRIGDTITDDSRPAPGPLPGFEEVKSMVFAGLYRLTPSNTSSRFMYFVQLRVRDFHSGRAGRSAQDGERERTIPNEAIAEI